VKRYLLFCLLLLTGCGGPGLEPLAEDDVVVAFGDSLTAGRGVNREAAYPAVLQSLIARTVINAGVSGETTAEGLLRLPVVLEEVGPDLLILIEGGNDILRGLDPAAAEQNLEAMIGLAKAQGIQVVLVGLPEKKLLSKTAKLYRQIASRQDLVLQDDIIASLLRNPSMKSDRVHFNALGYRKLALAIEKLLHDSGAL
jgi:lysophospholipase L1-like esterase